MNQPTVVMNAPSEDTQEQLWCVAHACWLALAPCCSMLPACPFVPNLPLSTPPPLHRLEITACKLLLNRIFPQPVWESLLHRYREQALHAESKEELFRHPSFALPSPPSVPRSLASFAPSSEHSEQRSPTSAPAPSPAPAPLPCQPPPVQHQPPIAFTATQLEARFHRWNAKRLARCDALRCASAALMLIGMVLLLSFLPGQAVHAWRTLPVLSWSAFTCIICSGLWLWKRYGERGEMWPGGGRCDAVDCMHPPCNWGAHAPTLMLPSGQCHPMGT